MICAWAGGQSDAARNTRCGDQALRRVRVYGCTRCVQLRSWEKRSHRLLARRLRRMKNANSRMASTKRGRSRPSAGWMYCLVRSLHGGPSENAIDKLCRLLFFIGTLKDAGEARVTAVVPYLCYARKDRRTKPNDPVITRFVASLLTAVGSRRTSRPVRRAAQYLFFTGVRGAGFGANPCAGPCRCSTSANPRGTRPISALCSWRVRICRNRAPSWRQAPDRRAR